MSRLIKSSHVISLEDLKKLEWARERLYRHQYEARHSRGEATDGGPGEEAIALRDQIVQDAEAFAEERVRQAAEEAERRLREAQEQIEAWWSERRQQDLEASEAARQAGFEQGFAEGAAHAREEASREWSARLEEARGVLEQAYAAKEQIIQEAEPFLVELSAAIAEKIIGMQLTLAPEIVIELARKSLARRREQGVITLCVSPSRLAFVQAAREELSLALDSQAELQILPDATVDDHGCVIRSAFGSIDARIDTQLEEIKRELVQVALNNDDRGNPDDGRAT